LSGPTPSDRWLRSNRPLGGAVGLLLLCAPLLVGCLQKLNTQAASRAPGPNDPGPAIDRGAGDTAGSAGGTSSGSDPETTRDGGGLSGGGGNRSMNASDGPTGTARPDARPAGSEAGPTTAGPPGADPCVMIRTQAHLILATNCAPCHEAPAKQGNFDFVLEVSTLTEAVSSTGKRFVVPGAPDDSRLYQRASAGEMPPPGRMPRPSADDIVALRAWIAGCIRADAPGEGFGDPKDAGTNTGGPAPAPPPDGGPGPGCGQPGQPCCVANACLGGGCCVLGQCRGQGQACAGSIGENGDDDGVPGTCSNGSCSKDGVACGSLAQPCCGAKATCTAARAECMMGATCQACGSAGQPCCGNGGNATCVEGLDCQGAGFGRVGVCNPCGGLGQLCCGNGNAAQQTCHDNLACRFVVGMGDRCGSP
jgi:hypothetical protein